MAFRSRRQHRYLILRDTGFLKFEARELSKIPFNIPYMDTLIKERYKAAKDAARDKITERGWKKIITNMYFDKGFTKTDKKTGKKTPDAWQMFRDFEFKFKSKHPEYESPWEKRRKNWKDFVAKIEKTYDKYPIGAAYNRKVKQAIEEQKIEDEAEEQE